MEGESAAVEMSGTDELSFPLREQTFLGEGIASDQGFTHNKAEYGIAQKLQLFVVERTVFWRGLIRGPRTMGEGTGKEAAIGEPVAECRFECGYRFL